MKVLANLNLSQNELQNAVIHKSAVAPESGVIGQIYFNTTDNKLFVYNGTIWEPIGKDVALAGGSTDTAEISINDNEITANVKISEDANNGLSIAPNGGLYVEYQDVGPATAEEDGLLTAEDKAKLDSIDPEASKIIFGEMGEPELNKVVIYNGETTDSFIKGHTYIGVEAEDGTLIWQEVMPTISGTTSPTAEVTVIDGTITTNVLLSETVGNGLAVDANGGLYVEYQEIGAATSEEDGLMTAADKAKLDAIGDIADKTAYSEVPEANVENAGMVIIYSGEANDTYVPGHVYRCVSNDEGVTYVWEEVMPTISGSESLTTTVVVSEEGVITTDVRLSTNEKNGLTVDANGGLLIEYQEVTTATETDAGLMTPEQVQHLASIEENAQVNKLEAINVNGKVLAITDKAVNVEVEANNGLNLETDDNGKITVEAKISTTEGNSLSIDENGLFVAVPTMPEYTVVKAETAETGYISTYNLQKDGVNIGASINIPKDFLVKTASIGEVVVEGQPYAEAQVGDKYLDFVINVKAGAEEAEEHIYLPVNELVDVYTAGTGIEISAGNVVNVKIISENGLDIDENGIKLGLASADANGAMSKEHFAKLEGVAEGAQVNVLEGVQFNGADIVVDENKTANIVINEATVDAAGLMSAADKVTLGANTEAIATKQDKLVAGTNIVIDDETNTINASIPVASADNLGGIKVGSGLTIDGAGVLSAAHKFTTIIGDGNATTFTITHNMNSSDVIVQISDVTTHEVVLANVAITSENAISVNFATAPAASAYKVVIID